LIADLAAASRHPRRPGRRRRFGTSRFAILKRPERYLMAALDRAGIGDAR